MPLIVGVLQTADDRLGRSDHIRQLLLAQPCFLPEFIDRPGGLGMDSFFLKGFLSLSVVSDETVKENPNGIFCLFSFKLNK